MMRPGTRFERLNWRQREAQLFGNHDIAVQRIASLEIKFNGAWRPPDWNVEVVRSKATDRITLRYVSAAAPSSMARRILTRRWGAKPMARLLIFGKTALLPAPGSRFPSP